jgi:hypothetical protein
MGKEVRVGVAAVFAAAVAFLVYQNVQQRKQLEQVVNQQEQIRKVLSEAREVASADDKASLLMREDLRILDALRTAVAEYYVSTGKMPSVQSDAGLPSPDRYRGKSLKSATVLPDGSIDLVFDATSGVDGGRVRFAADLSHADATGIQWHCETADYPLIRRVTPACDYRPTDAPTARR